MMCQLLLTKYKILLLLCFSFYIFYLNIQLLLIYINIQHFVPLMFKNISYPSYFAWKYAFSWNYQPSFLINIFLNLTFQWNVTHETSHLTLSRNVVSESTAILWRWNKLKITGSKEMHCNVASSIKKFWMICQKSRFIPIHKEIMNDVMTSATANMVAH